MAFAIHSFRRWWPRAQSRAKFRWLFAPLLPLLWLYYGITILRNFCYSRGICKRARVPALVISVGNLSMGGTGKTPATIFLANALRDQGWRVAVVARGYRRHGSGLVIVSDRQRLLADVAAAGDEPLEVARQCDGVPVIVDRKKKTAAIAAVEKFSLDIILVDDGFQHCQLHRQIDVVMIDASTNLRGFWWNIAHPFREPPSALQRADFIILNTSGVTDPDQTQRLAEQCRRHTAASIFSGTLKPTGWRKLEDFPGNAPCPLLPLSIIKDKPVVLVSGIARPERFRAVIEKLGARIRQELVFADHHRYAGRDARDIAAAFKDGAEYILTTTKDAVKLAHVFEADAAVLPILFLETVFEADPAFLSSLLKAISKEKRGGGGTRSL
jgi:tetraacyldisaccharide 4'-kinase